MWKIDSRATLVFGRRSELTNIYAGFAAPNRLPPPFTAIGAKLTLAYREWRAEAE